MAFYRAYQRATFRRGAEKVRSSFHAGGDAYSVGDASMKS